MGLFSSDYSDHSDDDASAEGQITRNLFRTSFSSCDEIDDCEPHDSNLFPLDNRDTEISESRHDGEHDALEKSFENNGNNVSTSTSCFKSSLGECEPNGGIVIRKYQPDGLLLAEQCTDGTSNELPIKNSIATQLWPAATVLAEFILRQASEAMEINNQKIYFDNDNNPGDTARDQEYTKEVRKSNGLDNAANRPSRDNENIRRQKKEALETLHRLLLFPLLSTPNEKLHILELGSGIGLTGLRIACGLPRILSGRDVKCYSSFLCSDSHSSCQPTGHETCPLSFNRVVACKVLLTDVDEALPILQKNINLNQEKFFLKCNDGGEGRNCDESNVGNYKAIAECFSNLKSAELYRKSASTENVIQCSEVSMSALYWDRLDQADSALSKLLGDFSFHEVSHESESGINTGFSQVAGPKGCNSSSINISSINKSDVGLNSNQMQICGYESEVFFQESPISETNDKKPILLLASDCVYFDELHLPLERTIARLLSTSPKGSIAIIAGARRWKRDNRFYACLGKATKNKSGMLECVLLEEIIERLLPRRPKSVGEESQEKTNKKTTGRGEILRIYAVRWVSKNA